MAQNCYLFILMSQTDILEHKDCVNNKPSVDYQWPCQNGRLVMHYVTSSGYTLLTLKYGLNLLNVPVSSILRQNLCAILTAPGSVQMHFPTSLLWHAIYFCKLSLTQIQKLTVLVMECKRASVLCIRVDIFTSYFKVNKV